MSELHKTKLETRHYSSLQVTKKKVPRSLELLRSPICKDSWFLFDNDFMDVVVGLS